MFGTGRTPETAAGAAILTALALLLVDERLRLVPRAFRERVAAAAIDAGRPTAGIAAIILCAGLIVGVRNRSEEQTSELQSLMRIPYAVFCLKIKTHVKT